VKLENLVIAGVARIAGVLRRQSDIVWSTGAPQMKSASLRSATEAVQIMRSVSEVCAGFEDQPQTQQRSIASTMLKRATWQNGELRTVLVEPYAALQHSNSTSRSKETVKVGSGQEIDNWLPGKLGFQLPLHKCPK
jgi:hypothetical protein